MNYTTLSDVKYIRLLGNRLQKFKALNSGVFVCRCSECGDSQKNARKTRMYFYPRKAHFSVFCHNCNYSARFDQYLKHMDANLYSEYCLENFNKNTEEVKDVEVIEAKNVSLQGLFKIQDIDVSHPVHKYIEKRQIPIDDRLYYSPHFAKWINSFQPNRLWDGQSSDPRLVLPLIDRKGKVFGVSARDLTNKSELRYITMVFDSSKPKVFGLDKIEPNYKIYVVESAIDSLFLPNCIAMNGADIPIDEVRDVINPKMNLDKFIFIYDNEPRNQQIVKRISNTIKKGFNVCLFPHSFPGKDINEAIQNGLNQTEIIELISNNTVKGLEAELKLSNWNRCRF